MKYHEKIPTDHSLVRYVPWQKLAKDGDDKVYGVLSDAFALRTTETNLSTTWVEYFAGSRTEKIESAAKAIRESMKVGSKSGFAIGKVELIVNACASRNHSIRVVYDPIESNKAHASIRQFPKEDSEILEILATEIWNELILNSNIPAGKLSAPDSPSG